MSLKILLVDDDPESLQSTARILQFAGHEVTAVESGESALALLRSSRPDLVVTDVRMPGMSGFEFVEAYQKMGHAIPFIVMTAFGDVKDAVWAMKMGAVDFLLKPFKRQALIDAIDALKVRLSNAGKIRGKESPDQVGRSKVMKELSILVEQVAKTDASVLILGESGSGKEQVARWIHEASPMRAGPFIAVNCAAIPENLIESELFGYERGAFSGASQSKPGLIEAANGGTLLLDEIGDMPLGLQPRLLRFLEEQTIRRLGANVEKKVQVRVIAATHRNLSQWVREQRFRQDLFYRLDVMTLQVPPLRERVEDVPDLARMFLKRFSEAYQKTVSGIHPEAEAALLSHSWPGNVRELSNVIERAVVLNQTGSISRSDLPAHLVADGPIPVADTGITIPLGMSLKEIEDLMIKKALEATQGDRAEAARLLGVNERTIYRRISKSKEE
ncbi:MAG: sigma-54-dependent Fis family transcriptional regulator [Proteobacteria bacterium]|nr:sigma-54-dependent Fis family transcriptional regulator [Pseudomonadota bacterium]